MPTRDAFNKREQADENYYVRKKEMEKYILPELAESAFTNRDCRLAALKEKIAQHQEHLKELDQQVYVYLIVFNHSRSPKWLTFSLVRTEWGRVRKRGQTSDSERDDQTETLSESGDDSLGRSIFQQRSRFNHMYSFLYFLLVQTQPGSTSTY